MQYNTMYDVYQEICQKYPGAPVTYNSSYDCMSFMTEKYEVTALSNYSQPVLSIRNSAEHYQYNIGNFEDASKFFSDLVSGQISFSYDKFSRKKRLKIDGWSSSGSIVKSKVSGLLSLISGIGFQFTGGMITIAAIATAIEDYDPEILLMVPLALGSTAIGNFLVTNKDKVKFLDFLGYFAGTSVTTIPMALLITMLSEGDVPLAVALGLSAVSWAVGRIIRKAALKHVEQSDDVFLDGLPGPVNSNFTGNNTQNGNYNNYPQNADYSQNGGYGNPNIGYGSALQNENYGDYNGNNNGMM